MALITVCSDDHLQHNGLLEEAGDTWAPGVEKPERALEVLGAIRIADLGTQIAPDSFDDAKILAIHEADYVEFLESAWTEWQSAGNTGSNARAFAFVGRGMRHADTRSIDGRLGRYSQGTDAPIVAGSWPAIRVSANIALTGAKLLAGGEPIVFSLCRPPGHHATVNQCGGYCYLNNTAIAAQSLLDAGAERIAVLDVDYHHGNGTQSIFYERSDVLTLSLHADPAFEYPFYLGYNDETGSGEGAGFNGNYPLPSGTGWSTYSDALADALQKIAHYSPSFLIVALGLDTYTDDPIASFNLVTDDYARMSEQIRRESGSSDRPTLVVLEGGYAVDAIGVNTVNFLAGIA